MAKTKRDLIADGSWLASIVLVCVALVEIRAVLVLWRAGFHDLFTYTFFVFVAAILLAFAVRLSTPCATRIKARA